MKILFSDGRFVLTLSTSLVDFQYVVIYFCQTLHKRTIILSVLLIQILKSTKIRIVINIENVTDPQYVFTGLIYKIIFLLFV